MLKIKKYYDFTIESERFTSMTARLLNDELVI